MAHLEAIVSHKCRVGKGLYWEKGLHKINRYTIIHEVRRDSRFASWSLSIPSEANLMRTRKKDLSHRVLFGTAGIPVDSFLFYFIEVIQNG